LIDAKRSKAAFICYEKETSIRAVAVEDEEFYDHRHISDGSRKGEDEK
jgi:hypothetical protein